MSVTRNENRMWSTPNGAIYRKWTDKEMIEIPFGKSITEKILWVICPYCGKSITTHYLDTVRPIDLKICISCQVDSFRIEKNKGWEYIETELKPVRWYEKYIDDIDGYWVNCIE